MFKVKFLPLPSILLMVLSILITFTTSNSANSAMGYRYWGYFQSSAGTNTWTAAMTGPSVEVKDGDVEGWAFVFSNNDIPAQGPMMDPDFNTLCGDTPETAGKVRVGLVVDFGAANIAPVGETPMEFFSDCVTVNQGAIGLDVLQSALEVRAGESGLICGIAGYPAAECGAEISAPTEDGQVAITKTLETQTENRSTAPLLLGVLALMLLSGFFLNRRRTKR
jgi:hypothetical protein